MKFNDEPMISQKDYTTEEYKKKKRKAIGVAKRLAVLAKLIEISIINLCTSLAMFLLLSIGIGAIPYFCNVDIEFTPENFSLRGGVFITLSIIFLISFTILGIWYAIAYKRLEIICIHLDGGLEGALEVNEAAQRDALMNSLERVTGMEPTNFQSMNGPEWVAIKYLQENSVDVNNVKVFAIIKVLSILAQILLAVLCLFLLIK